MGVPQPGGAVHQRRADGFGTADATGLESAERLEGLVIEANRDRSSHETKRITDRDTHCSLWAVSVECSFDLGDPSHDFAAGGRARASVPGGRRAPGL